MSHRLSSVIFGGIVVVILGCASNPLPVQMRGLHLRSVRPDFTTRSVTIDLEMRFRLNNLSSAELTIPDHQATFELAGREMGLVQPLFPSGTAIPADGSVDLAYRVKIDTGLLSPAEQQSVLGRDVPYRFAAHFEIPLPEEIPVEALEAFGLDPNLAIAFEDTIRVPRLPEAAPHGLPTIELLGGEIHVVQRDVDLGIVEDGFRLAFAGIVATATGGDAVETQKWMDLFDVMVDPQIHLVEMAPVSGMTVRVPIQIKNPNHFDIALPSVALDFDANSKDVWTLTQTPSSATLRKVGEPGSTRNVTYESTYHFDSLGDAVFSTDRVLEVDTSVDLGHGSTELPIRLP